MSKERDLQIAKMVQPQALRQKYGDEIAENVCEILSCVTLRDDAIVRLLRTLDKLGNEYAQTIFLQIFENRMYEHLADEIITNGGAHYAQR